MIFWICAGFLAVVLIYHFLTKKYLNPYKLIFVFGKKGSGKSTFLTKLSVKYLRKGWNVYSTEVKPVDGVEIPAILKNVTYVEPRRLYSYNFPPNSCIFIDEASLIWDNRDFKTMDKRIIEWYRYQRHHRCRVYLFSQSWDVDSKIRSLCDDFYLCEKKLRVFSVASHIVRKPVVVHPSPDAPARIDDDMIVDGPLLTFFGGKMFAFIPYWAKFFDSHKEATDDLSPQGDARA